MKLLSISAPVVIKKFSKHCELKEKILKDINMAEAENIKSIDTNISRCDWNLTFEKSWTNTLIPYLEKEVIEIYKSLGYEEVMFYNIWFQQYSTGGNHNWHVHTECQWTNVYYLDLPDSCPKTEIFDPITGNITILDIEEGDLCCFPSYVIHRAPLNNSDKTKTIISFNSGTDVKGGKYE